MGEGSRGLSFEALQLLILYYSLAFLSKNQVIVIKNGQNWCGTQPDLPQMSAHAKQVNQV